MKILIVDDNAKNRKLCRAILVQQGYTALEAKDGAEGLAVARNELPALIFMDIQMPVLGGRESLKRLRAGETTKNIPVIALTSYAMKGDRERLLESGFRDYISKPINIDAFLEVIKRYTA
ncbi:MAG: response regulator [Candidatus Methylomirabilia bacterium]